MKPVGVLEHAINLSAVMVRLIEPAERERWDELMRAHHYLGLKALVGRSLRYVAHCEGQWLALLGWASAAKKCAARDAWIGWSAPLQWQRIGLLANNARFVLLPGPRVPNLASGILAANLARLSADWLSVHGQPLLLAETFVDPTRFAGTCYRAANWIDVGATRGFAKTNATYIEHGQPKRILVYPLVRQARAILCSPLPHARLPRVPAKSLELALDGTDFFSSKAIHCKCCSRAEQKNGDTLYRHTVVTPVLVAPGQEQVIVLPPEFVQPQDGHDKQDCELAASGRWLNQHAAHYAAWRITLLGDDLYCHQPFCQRTLDANMDFIFTCKPDSHAAVYEWVADFTRSGQIGTLTRTRRTGKKHFTDTYRYQNDVPLRDSDDALLVNWCELLTTREDGTVQYRNAWASSHRIDEHNVELVAKAGRARWKIENENNNTLKTKGYHFEHNFGHGKQHLANLLATMILLAFLMHTCFDWLDQRYRAVRCRLPSRRTFFENVRTLLLYLPFDSWDHLLGFMLSKLNPPHAVNAPDTG